VLGIAALVATCEVLGVTCDRGGIAGNERVEIIQDFIVGATHD
jgi:hypothetical protein